MSVSAKKSGPFKCPLCEQELVEQFGNQMYPGNPDFGVTLYCPNPMPACPAQEVMGHGDNAKGAYEIILQKYRRTYDDSK